MVDIFDAAVILLLFLPPYSPDYNPIEETFSYIKGYLKEHDPILQVLDDPMPIIRGAFNSITQEQCNAGSVTLVMHSINNHFIS